MSWKKQWTRLLRECPKAKEVLYTQALKFMAVWADTWDYGNLGVELKNNVKKAWWKKFIQESPI